MNMALAAAQFPRCMAYLRGVDRRAANSSGMTVFGAAVIIADALPLKVLKSAGFVWPDGNHDGQSILASLETVLSGARKSKTRRRKRRA